MKNKLKSSLNIESPKIAIYMRVSTSKQADNQSLDTQENTINSYIASRHDWINPICYKYVESHSASLKPKASNNLKESSFDSLKRPKLRELFLDATIGKFDYVLCASHDRLTRNTNEGIILKHLFSRLNITLIYCRPGETISSENEALNKFFENLLVNIAALESNITGGRVALANKHKIQNNFWAGGPPPFGYNLVSQPNNKRNSFLEINFEEARIVKKIFELYNLGCSYNEILTRLNRDFTLPPKRLWTHNTLKEILRNPVYTGFLVWNKRGGARKPNRHSPNDFVKSNLVEKNIIIPENEFLETQKLRNILSKDSKFLSTDFLLRDFLYCNKCNKKLLAKNYGNNKRFYYCYSHNSMEINKKCRSIKASKIESTILSNINDLINSSLQSKVQIEKFYDNYIENFNAELLDNKKSLEITINQLKSSTDLLELCVNEINISKDNLTVDYENFNSNSTEFSFINALSEFQVITQTEIKSLKARKEYLTYKINSSPKSFDDFKSNLNKSFKLFKYDEEKQKLVSSPRSFRLFLFKVVKKIILSDHEITIIFK
ncbi:recombinase family protein [Clostridium perfringens]